MKEYTLYGKLKYIQSKHPLIDYKVTAWDKDKNTSDQLGFDITDEQGRFHITFDTSKYFDGKEDSLPDVFFLIYKEDRLIHSTEGRPIKNLTGDWEGVIEIDFPEEAVDPIPEPEFFVSGRVLNAINQQPLSSLTVEAWDKDRNVSDQLGMSVTDSEGGFFISYPRERFGDDHPNPMPDVFFRIYADGWMVYSTEGDPIGNVTQLKDHVIEVPLEIDQPISPEPTPLPSEEVELFEMNEYATPENLVSSAPEFHRSLQLKAIQQIHNGLQEHFQQASIAARYFIKSLRFSIPDTDESPFSLEATVQNALQRFKSSTALAKEVQETFNSYNGQKSFDDTLPTDMPLRKNPMLNEQFRQLDLRRIGGLGQLGETEVSNLIKHNFQPEAFDQDQLESFVEEGLLSNEQAVSLSRNAVLYGLSLSQASMVEALKGHFETTPNIRQLIPWKKSDWVDLMDTFNIDSPLPNTTREEHATFLQKQVEMLFPNEVVMARYEPVEVETTNRHLDIVSVLAAKNENLFAAESFEALDLADVEPEKLEDLKTVYTSLVRTAKNYPGLDLITLFNDSSYDTVEKVREASRRTNLVRQFFDLYPEVPFLTLDLHPDSEDLQELHLEERFSEPDKDMLISNLLVEQHLYAITKDAELSTQLKQAGFYSADQIVYSGPYALKKHLNVSDQAFNTLFKGFKEWTRTAGLNAGFIIDQLSLITKGSMADNSSPEIRNYISRLPGFSEWFGNQNYCECSHCQSIISPAAYFVDLIDFIERYVIQAHFSEDSFSTGNIHDLNLKKRRSDLWFGVPLTCENTNGLVPYLTIILEVLENYLYLDINPEEGRKRDSGRSIFNLFTDPEKRRLVEQLVYFNRLYAVQSIGSIHQPFNLPLVELQTYLQHFNISRGQIAQTVLAGENEHVDFQALAHLGISQTEYELIKYPFNHDVINGKVKWDKLFRDPILLVLPHGQESAPDLKVFLKGLDVSRKDFGKLIETKFVGGAHPPSIVPIIEEGETQPTREVMLHYDTALLDRLHRFTRLIHASKWNVEALDQILHSLNEANLLFEQNGHVFKLSLLATLHKIQDRFSFSADEICTLIFEIPTEGESSHFDQLFNLPTYKKTEVWEKNIEKEFTHPGFQDELPEDDGNQLLHRILAGLNISDDELITLIENVPNFSSGTFTINLSSLTVLLRHVLLFKKLKIDVEELFALIRISGKFNEYYISEFSEVVELIDFYDWWKESGYTLRELALLLNDTYGLREGDTSAMEINRKVLDSIVENELLIFSETSLSLLPGVTEIQSKEIIKSNPDNILKADIRIYKVVNNNNTINIPQNIHVPPGTLEKIEQLIERYKIDGAPTISDRSFMAQFELSTEQASSILKENLYDETTQTGIFAAVEDEDLFVLSKTFDVIDANSIIVPPNIPITNLQVVEFLKDYSASNLFNRLLAQELGISEDKLLALGLMTQKELSGQDWHKAITQIVSGELENPEREITLTEIGQITESLQRLVLLFKDKVFSEDTLAFILENSGTSSQLFHFNNYEQLSLDEIRQIVDFRALLRANKGVSDDLYNLLSIPASDGGYNFDAEPGFGEKTIPLLEKFLGSKSGLIQSFNLHQNFAFPGGNGTNSAIQALLKLQKNISLAQHLGVSGEALLDMLAEVNPDNQNIEDVFNQLRRAVLSVTTAVRTKYEKEEEYQNVVEPFEDKIREKRRTALIDYFLQSVPPENPSDPKHTDRFQTVNDLYHYFLIDTELEGCARTSRIVAGLSSLQLYVQRVILNLEQTEVGPDQPGHKHVMLTDESIAQWEWRKNYRVWEANRKVFL